MIVRTKNELKDILDKDFSWRRVELTVILSNVKSSTNKANQVAIRTAVLLLYAHWEGFIKKAAETYLNFVKNQQLSLENLKDSFLALALKQKLITFENTNKSTNYCKFINFIRNNLNSLAVIDDSKVISAKSNLNSEILKQVLTTIGIDFSQYALKSNLIDSQLLNYRNTIAHGEYLLLDKKEYANIHKEILQLMNDIKTDIENAVFMDAYKM